MRVPLSSAFWTTLVFYVQFSPFLVRSAPSTINLSVNEETPINALVENVWKSLYGRERTEKSYFRTIPPSSLFSIDENGDIRIASRIDREDPETCKDASETKPCVIQLNVFNPELSSIIINIEVKDINDNEPQFKEKYIVINVEENTKKLNFLLEKPTDLDIGDNGLNVKGRYYLKEDEDLFTLDNSAKSFLYLTLKDSPTIDYESQKQYNLTLSACDGAVDLKCSDQYIAVQVIDKNDNSPNITKVVANVMLENATIGSTFARIYAHDADSGENGRLTFQIADRRLAEIFEISDSGALRSKQSLNAKVQSEFVVPVKVSDNGTPKNTVAMQVTVKISDVNDHSPVIKQIPWVEGAHRTEVEENSAAKQITLLQVSDGDMGENANVTCVLSSETDRKSFRLDKSSNSLYILSIVKPFDYEIMESENVLIRCKDNGVPPQESSDRVTVNFKNVNEYQPTFQTPSALFVAIDEETEIGKDIFTVFAYDRDRGENLKFSADSDYFDIFTLPSTFDIDKTIGKGLLRIKKTIDRESLSTRVVDDTIKFEIFVSDTKDSKGTRYTVSTTMTVSIKDINDNIPRVVPPLKFLIQENQKSGTRALSFPEGQSKIKYVDPDRDSNGAVYFKLIALKAEEAFSKRPLHFNQKDWPFRVTESGEIETTKKLDREQYDRYMLTIMAYNQATSLKTQLNSTEVVYVEVQDENDNAPVWIIPSNEDVPINITASQRVNEEVTRVEAKDIDLNTNLTYTLTGNSGFFEVHSLSGKVILVRKLSPGRHHLTIRADDNGSPNQWNHTTLNINVFQSDAGFGNFKDAQINLTIIIAMIVITALVSIGLVFAIICVRRRTQGFIPPSECDKEGCQCQCSLPDMDMQSMMAHEPYYGQFSKPPASRMDRLFPMTTFNNNTGSGYDIRPAEHIQRNEIVINQQDLDGDSADSGRGGSEDDHGGHVMNNRIHQLGSSSGSATLPRRVASPTPGSIKAPCQCLGIPEEDGTNCECSQSPPPLNAQLSSFLPPPVPPHGVEYRNTATLPRLLTSRPHNGRMPFQPDQGTTSTPAGKTNGNYFASTTLTRSPLPEHSNNPYLRQLNGLHENKGSPA